MKLAVPENVTWKNLQSGVVVLHLDSGTYFTLNDTASFLWLKICEGLPEERIVDAFVEHYACGREQACGDIRECVEYLRGESLLCEA